MYRISIKEFLGIRAKFICIKIDLGVYKGILAASLPPPRNRVPDLL